MFYNDQPDPGQVRHHCRNPRCAGKLKVPSANRRDAFCCSGCERTFYRPRCRVCERLFTRKTERRIVCSRAKCRYAFKRHPEEFFGSRYPYSGVAHNASRNPLKTGTKIDAKCGQGFRIVAGPEVPEINLRIPPEVPGWKANRKYWAEAERRAVAAGKVLITRDKPPVNIIGGYKWPGAPKIDLRPAPATSRAPAGPPAGDGLDIPSFLRREA